MLRGDICIYKLPDVGKHIQNGIRPVICVSNNINNAKSEVVQVLAISTKKDKLPMHVEINSTKEKSYVFCEQIFTIRKDEIISYVGHATKNEMKKINRALLLQIGGE